MIKDLLTAGAGMGALLGILGLAAFIAIVIRPRFGPYTYLIASPLIMGVARGDLLAIARPNELLLIIVAAALATRTLLLMLAGRYSGPLVNRLDLALIALALASSVFPLLMRVGRSLPLSSDDLLYSMVLWKYFILYRVFRASITTPSQVMHCLELSLISATAAAIIGALQVTSLLGVPEFLHAYYEKACEGCSGPMTERASSTFASAFAFADVMIMNLVIAIALLHGRPRGRWLLICAAGLFLSGCITAGEFSGVIGLGVAVFVYGAISGRLSGVLGFGLPATVSAAVVFWPVVAKRLSEFAGSSGLPHSWTGRWENLQNFFFPDLFSGINWLTGVRPAARLPAPETWREWVYIENGYVWLLWIGGIPFFAAFVLFVWVATRHLWRVFSDRRDAVGVAAAASLSYLAVIVTLMLFDPHLTVRGSADLFFPLLALSSVRGRLSEEIGQAGV